MYNILKSTYTFEDLKTNVFKVMGEFSLNGTENSLVSGYLADAGKRFLSTLNMCLRRVVLSLPLLEKSVELEVHNGRIVLPGDCGKIKDVFCCKGKKKLSDNDYSIFGNELVCTFFEENENVRVLYLVVPESFSSETVADTKVELPDITCDALCYLTAAELCSPEYAELYSKLMYKYRDICANFYNCENSSGSRNSFFKKRPRGIYGNS